MTGLQDNGTIMFTGSKTWELPLTGDGCDSGFDATDAALPLPHVHERADGHQLRRLQPEHLALDRRPLRRQLPGVGPLLLTDGLRSGADEDDLRRRAERLADVGRGRRPRVPGAHCNVTTHPRQGPEQPAVHRGLWLGCRLAEARHVDADEQHGDVAVRHDEGRQHDRRPLARPGRRHDVGGHRRRPRADLEEHQRRRSGDGDVHPARRRLAGDAGPRRVVDLRRPDEPEPRDRDVLRVQRLDTAATPGHVFDVVFDPSTGLSTWTDISYDIGDQPINDAVLDTDDRRHLRLDRLQRLPLTHGTQTWAPVSDGLPMAAVSGLTLAKAQHGPDPVHLRGDARSRRVPAHAAQPNRIDDCRRAPHGARRQPRIGLPAVKVLSVVGNRPQFIKSAPLSLALRAAGVDEVVLHTRPALRPRAVAGLLRRARARGARVPARPAHGRSATRWQPRDPRGARARAAGLGARLRRHELDARRRAGRGRAQASRSRTSRPGCGAATSRCPRSATASRSTALAELLLAPDERLARRRSQAKACAGRIEVVGDVMRDALDLFAPIALADARRVRVSRRYLVCTIHREANVRARAARAHRRRGRPHRRAVRLPGAPAHAAVLDEHGISAPHRRTRRRRSATSTSLALVVAGARDRHRLGRAAEGGVLVRRAVRHAAAVDGVGGHRHAPARTSLVDDDPTRSRRRCSSARSFPDDAPELYGDGTAAGRVVDALYPSRAT